MKSKIKKIFFRVAGRIAGISLILIAIFFVSLLRHTLVNSPINITINKGETLTGSIRKLKETKLISSPLFFNILMRFSDSIKAGDYEFKGELSGFDIKNILVAGASQQQIKITIPEGKTILQIKKILEASPDLTGEITTEFTEGSLLPETYNFDKGTSRNEVLKTMQKHMQETLKSLWEKRETQFFSSPEQALILASIVEKETRVASERSVVASVFLNRLVKGIALQTDPTVVYAITNGLGDMQGRRLWSKYLKVDSPYNTYKYPGLPPTPIANPGRASIEAVLHPAQTKYLYFVADGTGGHIFASNLKEHNRNVKAWQKFRQDNQI